MAICIAAQCNIHIMVDRRPSKLTTTLYITCKSFNAYCYYVCAIPYMVSLEERVFDLDPFIYTLQSTPVHHKNFLDNHAFCQ